MKRLILLGIVLSLISQCFGQAEPFIREWPGASIPPLEDGSRHYTALDRVIMNPGIILEASSEERMELYLSSDIVYEENYVSDELLSNLEYSISTELEVGAMGGYFNVDGLGGGTYTIPINVPIGINGMQPELSLVYNSNALGSFYGRGWSLNGLSSISRQKLSNMPGLENIVSFDNVAHSLENSDLVLDNNLMVKVSEDAQASTFILKDNPKQYQVQEFQISNESYFVVQDNQGITYRYGYSENSRLENSHWLLDKVEDRIGNRIEYEFLGSGNFGAISRIRYTLNQSEGEDGDFEVRFVYQERADDHTSYYNGRLYTSNVLLRAIRTFVHDKLYSGYDLNYAYRDESFLQSVEYQNSQGEYLNPTVFNYSLNDLLENSTEIFSNGGLVSLIKKRFGDFNGDGIQDVYGQVAVHDLEEGVVQPWDEFRIYTGDGTGQFQLYTSGNIPVDYVGAIIAGEDASGIVMNHTFSNLRNLNGMRYSPDPISALVSYAASKALEEFAPQKIPKTYFGVGSEHTVFDYNGDGRDDILIVQKNLANDVMISATVKIVHSANDIQDLILYEAPVTDPENPEQVFHILQPKAAVTGDFDGNGSDDVIINSNSSVSGFATSKLYYYDVSQTDGSASLSLNGAFGSNSQVFSVDIYSNGQDELVLRNSNGDLSIYQLGFNNFSSTAYLDPQMQLIQTRAGVNESVQIADVNNDGQLDIYWIEGDYLKIFHPFGEEGAEETSYFAYFGVDDLPDLRQFDTYSGDFDGDGLIDLVCSLKISYPDPNAEDPDFPGADILTYRMLYMLTCERGNMTYRSLGNDILDCLDCNPQVIPIDINLDGRIELVEFDSNLSDYSINKVFANSEQHALKRVVNGMGIATEVDYARPKITPNLYPESELPGTLVINATSGLVVNAVRTAGPNESISEVNYEFTNPVFSLDDGYLGYQEVKLTNNISQQELFGHIVFTADGSLSRSTILALSTDMSLEFPDISEQTSNYELILESQGIPQNDYVLAPETRRIRLSDTRSIDYLTGRESRSDFTQYNGDDLIEHVDTRIGQIGFADGNEQMFISSETEYWSESGNWWIDYLPYNTTSSRTRFGESLFERKARNNYDSNGTLQSIEDLDKGVLTEFMNYDGYGNYQILQRSVPGSNENIRTTLLEYDNTQRSVAKVTDQLGRETSWEFDDVLGLPTEETDQFGNTTILTYDGFGRTVEAKNAYGQEVFSKYEWENEGECEVPGSDHNSTSDVLFSVTNWGDDIPWSKVYMNRLGQERLSEHVDQFNNLVSQFVRYDDLGRLERTTDPFHAGQSEINITRHRYNDPFLRKSGIDIEDWSGNQLMPPLLIDYSIETEGYKITRTAPDGTITSSLVDWAGQTKETIDEGGTVEFSYFSHGNVKDVKVNSVLTSSMVYDPFGRQVELKDYNTGPTRYLYDAYDRVIHQTDSRGYGFTLEYDEFGRIEKKRISTGATINTDDLIFASTADEGFYEYQYHESDPHIGLIHKLISPEPTTYTEYMYTQRGQVEILNEVILGESFQYMSDYDGKGRLSSMTYPIGITIENEYDTEHNGYLSRRVDENNNAIWGAQLMNAKGQYTSFIRGVQATEYNFDRYGQIKATEIGGGALQNLQMEFDKTNGNLLFRKDLLSEQVEWFNYDQLNRLTHSVVSDDLSADGYDFSGVACKVEYGSQCGDIVGTNGNITYKQELGQYVYESMNTSTGQFRPHAVSKVTDPQDILSHEDKTMGYNSFHSISSIDFEGTNYTVEYGADDQRRRSMFSADQSTTTTTYAGSYERKVVEENGVTHTYEVQYVSSPTGLSAMYVKVDGAMGNWYYPILDHLGSILGVYDEAGNKVTGSEMNYDAWGRFRETQNWNEYLNESPIADGTAPPWLWRGYSGHEHIDEFGLINMNGRCYDPLLGRMLSPDNFVQNPGHSQSHNRYSYVLNNPLKYTDPTGEYWRSVVVGLASTYLTGSISSGTLNPGDWEAKDWVLAGIVGISSAYAYDKLLNDGALRDKIGYGKISTGQKRAPRIVRENYSVQPPKSEILLSLTPDPRDIIDTSDGLVLQARWIFSRWARRFSFYRNIKRVQFAFDNVSNDDDISVNRKRFLSKRRVNSIRITSDVTDTDFLNNNRLLTSRKKDGFTVTFKRFLPMEDFETGVSEIEIGGITYSVEIGGQAWRMDKTFDLNFKMSLSGFEARSLSSRGYTVVPW